MDKIKKKNVAILGSTGSIGTQALDVIKANPDYFSVEVLTAHSNHALLLKQAIEFKPNCVVIGKEEFYKDLSDELWNHGIKTYCGAEALNEVVQMDDVDIVLTAMVGYAGLKPTLSAIQAKKPIALANKETLVVAGDLITKEANLNQVPLLPVDSEHSALFQCLVGEFHNPIEKIILTASGGPFRNKTSDELKTVSLKQALKHPNWEMGAKITIDSATLVNKGLEVIEAKWLFDLSADQIEVIVHPQSIIHSIVQFKDGSMKAQMGLPDMKLPIQYALTYPKRLTTNFPRFNFADYANLEFEAPDFERFKNLGLAYKALNKGGNAACILNAANEITNEAFRKEQIGFLDIANINESVMERASFVAKPQLNDYIESNIEARKIASEAVSKSKA